MAAFTDPLDALEAVIRSRRGADPASSYVASLFAKGRPKIAQKLGEEAVEAAIASVRGDRAGLVGEAADVMFHLLVVLVDGGISLDEVRAELARREGISGLVEKAARPAPTAPAPAAPQPGLPLGSAADEGHVASKSHGTSAGKPRPLPIATGDY